MSAAFRRYEILLPLRFNDGRVVPDALVAEELVVREAAGLYRIAEPFLGEWVRRLPR